MILLKMGKHSDFHLNFFQSLGAMEFYSCHKMMENFKSYMIFRDAVSKLEKFVLILNYIFKVHSLVSVHLKSIIFGQVINLNMIFHIDVCGVSLSIGYISKITPVPCWIFVNVPVGRTLSFHLLYDRNFLNLQATGKQAEFQTELINARSCL